MSEKPTPVAPVQNIVHTPGPWEAYYVSSSGWSVRMSHPREGFNRPDPICSMAWWQFDKPGIIDNDISEANAKLIAAAPVMLEVLRKFMDFKDSDYVPNGIFERARIAIEKATK
jgi:hypothetical protein